MSGLAGMYDLRNEEEAKEYLEKVGIEYRYQCYHEKLPDGCHRLADFLEAFKRDEIKARKVYLKNCEENNYGHSCFKLGIYSMTGRGGEPKDYLEAYKYYAKGCDDGYAPSCHNAALMHSTAHLEKDPQKRDHVKASKLLQKACDMGNAPSCHLLSTYHIQGKNGIPKNMERAFNLAKKACDMGHMYSCANVSVMYKKGDGVKKDLQMSKKFEEIAKGLYDQVAKPEKPIHLNE